MRCALCVVRCVDDVADRCLCRLLSVKAQEAYFGRLLDRYTKFCTEHCLSLDRAFEALPRAPSEDPNKNPPIAPPSKPPATAQKASKSDHQESAESPDSGLVYTPIAEELSLILVGMRKLREAILVTRDKTSVPFAQRVHVFCIRAGILSEHPPSYYPPLKRLLDELHTTSNPLCPKILREVTTYMILDIACRQCDVEGAYELRAKAKAEFGYGNPVVDGVLRAVLYEHWTMFWNARREAEGYSKVLIDWASDWMRLRALKVISKSYITIDLEYLIRCCTGEKDGMTWEELVEKESLGWIREGDKIVVRRMRPRGVPKKAA